MRIKILVASALGAGALLLSACGPDPATPGTAASNGASPGASAAGGSGGGDRDACLIGTWNVDVDDMAAQAAAKIPQPGTTGKGSGTIVLTFGAQMSITYDSTLTISSPISGMTMDMAVTTKGTASSSDWIAKDGRLAGTMPTNTVVQSMTATIGGREAPLTSMPFQGALDLSEGNLGYSCSGGAATFTGPGVIWKLSKA